MFATSYSYGYRIRATSRNIYTAKNFTIIRITNSPKGRDEIFFDISIKIKKFLPDIRNFSWRYVITSSIFLYKSAFSVIYIYLIFTIIISSIINKTVTRYIPKEFFRMCYVFVENFLKSLISTRP